MGDVLYHVSNLKRYFPASRGGTVKALDGVSFDVFRGETLSLVGESGCGKTTCGRTLLGIYPATSGTVTCCGNDIAAMNRAERTAFRRKNQMIFQDPYASLDPRMTISTIIEEGMRVHFRYDAQKRRQTVADLLRKVGLPEEYASRFPHELSGGQRQRIGIARALALKPEFLVCDEPIAALDVSIQAQIINLLIDLQREMGLTYLMISHDLSVVRHISDRIAVMYLGVIVELADTVSLYRRPLHPYTKALFSAIPIPDPEEDWSRRRIRLSGEVPNPVNPPPGCKFCGRCPMAAERCRSELPQLRELEPGHWVACHFSGAAD